MHTLQTNTLIRFLTSSTYFERNVFIIRKTICTGSFYGIFFMHLLVYKQSRRWKSVFKNFRVQTVFLMMNPLGSKHVEDVKNRIKALI